MFQHFLQILDDGRLTDSRGKNGRFRICNDFKYWQHVSARGVNSNGEIKPEAEKSVNEEMRRHFRPEFLNS